MGNCACLPGNKHRSTALGPVPKAVSELFQALSQGKATLTEEVVRTYLKAQGVVSSETEVHHLIASCKQAVSNRRTSGASEAGPLDIDLDEFLALLQDTDVNALHEVGKVTHDMSLPLSHYYIYTGHNSYLSGNQLNSDSSAVPIIDALKRGCRVIELDCWPDGDDQIKVVHGMTLCKPAPVLELLHAIKEYAFVASDFPLMLTIENHLPVPLQNLLAQHFKDIFGEQLFTKTSDGPLLSPNDLKRRFLISTKSTKETAEGVKGAKKPPPDLTPVAEGGIPAEEPEDDIKRTGQGPEAASNGHETAGSNPGSKRPSLAEVDAEAVVADVATPSDAAEFDKSLSSLIYIPTLKSKLVGTPASERKAIRASFSEPQFDEVAEKDPLVLTKFSQHNMVRVYPYGLRFDSSNLDPVKVWCHGGQLAAMNMQGYGRNLWLAHGFFLANGGCGYVRKPEFFYPPSTEIAANGTPVEAVFNPRQTTPVRTTLKIRILWGCDTHKRFDAMSLPDFFVRVAVCGVPVDTKKSHTKVHRNTNHPIWENELFEFPLTAPELAILALEVRESDTLQRDDFACQVCIPVAEMRTGIRSVAMKDAKGNVIPDGQAKLLVHVELSA
ncbi:Phosphoinositide-specific Phospholipase C [Klebsormidium nitens]|uniref:Phosphoinositide phospholipase C n=1 Tax=Klebsormidium nitens TaxID=105231 RepID=A0A1Y1I5Y4_KLENI|nr:Phosphoinositide-specific Phospholipase C [Klebsormidium nitens]|eukprot:GAQ84819.1 Phosphoinositide-specific Phospholipase C [Klebsormidium nitens]